MKGTIILQKVQIIFGSFRYMYSRENVMSPEKMVDVNVQIKGIQTEQEEKRERQQRSLATKTSTQTDYFLNESFAKDFF